MRHLRAEEGVAVVGQWEGVVHDTQLRLRGPAFVRRRGIARRWLRSSHLRVMLRQRAEHWVCLRTIRTKQINVGVKDNGGCGVAKGETIGAGRDGDLAKAVGEHYSDDEKEKHGGERRRSTLFDGFNKR